MGFNNLYLIVIRRAKFRLLLSLMYSIIPVFIILVGSYIVNKFLSFFLLSVFILVVFFKTIPSHKKRFKYIKEISRLLTYRFKKSELSLKSLMDWMCCNSPNSLILKIEIINQNFIVSIQNTRIRNVDLIENSSIIMELNRVLGISEIFHKYHEVQKFIHVDHYVMGAFLNWLLDFWKKCYSDSNCKFLIKVSMKDYSQDWQIACSNVERVKKNITHNLMVSSLL